MGIRRAVAGDINAIHPVLDQLMRAQKEGRAEIWSRLLTDPSYASWVVEEDHQIVGFLDVLIWPDIGHGRKVGLVNNLVIDERRRGRGLGTGLLREAIRHCREEGVVELHVWTDIDDRAALTLYKKTGFVDRGLLLELRL